MPACVCECVWERERKQLCSSGHLKILPVHTPQENIHWQWKLGKLANDCLAKWPLSAPFILAPNRLWRWYSENASCCGGGKKRNIAEKDRTERSLRWGRSGVFVFICWIWKMKRQVGKLEGEKREGDRGWCTTNQRTGTHPFGLCASLPLLPPRLRLLFLGWESMQIVGWVLCSVRGPDSSERGVEISYSRQGKAGRRVSDLGAIVWIVEQK